MLEQLFFEDSAFAVVVVVVSVVEVAVFVAVGETLFEVDFVETYLNDLFVDLMVFAALWNCFEEMIADFVTKESLLYYHYSWLQHHFDFEAQV